MAQIKITNSTGYSLSYTAYTEGSTSPRTGTIPSGSTPYYFGTASTTKKTTVTVTSSYYITSSGDKSVTYSNTSTTPFSKTINRYYAARLITSNDGNGSVSPSDETAYVTSGSYSWTLSAKPEDNYELDYYEAIDPENVSVSGSTATVYASRTGHVKGHFKKKLSHLKVTNKTKGTIDCSVYNSSGTLVASKVINEDKDYTFDYDGEIAKYTIRSKDYYYITSNHETSYTKTETIKRGDTEEDTVNQYYWFTINFSATGASNVPSSIDSCTTSSSRTLSIPSNIPTLASHKFDHWKCGDVNYYAGSKGTFAGNKGGSANVYTLVAIWKTATYHITNNTNADITWQVDSETKNTLSPGNDRSPSRSTAFNIYIESSTYFISCSTVSGTKVPTKTKTGYAPLDNSTVEGPVYPYWYIKVNFDSNGGSYSVNSITACQENNSKLSIVLPAGPKYDASDSFDFNYWADSAGNRYNAESTFTTSGSCTQLASITLHAVWKNNYTLTLSSNSSSQGLISFDGSSYYQERIKTQKGDVNFSIYSSSKDGYYFAYWTRSNLNVAVKNSSAYYTIASFDESVGSAKTFSSEVFSYYKKCPTVHIGCNTDSSASIATAGAGTISISDCDTHGSKLSKEVSDKSYDGQELVPYVGTMSYVNVDWLGQDSSNKGLVPGSKLHLYAKPAEGFEFYSWSDGTSTANYNYTLPTKDTSLYAFFKPIKVTRSLSVIPSAAAEKSYIASGACSASEQISSGSSTSVQLYETSKYHLVSKKDVKGYTFSGFKSVDSGWTIYSSSLSDITIGGVVCKYYDIPNDYTYHDTTKWQALYEGDKYILAIKTENAPSGITITPEEYCRTQGAQISYGDEISIRVSGVDDTYKLTQWEFKDASGRKFRTILANKDSDDSYSLTYTHTYEYNVYLYAVFEKKTAYKVSVSSHPDDMKSESWLDYKGTYYKEGTVVTVYEGDSFTIGITPVSGEEINYWYYTMPSTTGIPTEKYVYNKSSILLTASDTLLDSTSKNVFSAWFKKATFDFYFYKSNGDATVSPYIWFYPEQEVSKFYPKNNVQSYLYSNSLEMYIYPQASSTYTFKRVIITNSSGTTIKVCNKLDDGVNYIHIDNDFIKSCKESGYCPIKIYVQYNDIEKDDLWIAVSVSGGTGHSGTVDGAAYAGQPYSERDSTYYQMSSPYVGQCTWYANGRTAEMRQNANACAPYGPSSKGWNNADVWLSKYGGYWKPTSVPHVGDAAIWASGCHVGVVENIDGDTIYVSSFNRIIGVSGYDDEGNPIYEYSLTGNGTNPYVLSTFKGFLTIDQNEYNIPVVSSSDGGGSEEGETYSAAGTATVQYLGNQYITHTFTESELSQSSSCTLIADPNDGFKFAHWETPTGQFIEEQQVDIDVTSDTYVSGVYVAVFYADGEEEPTEETKWDSQTIYQLYEENTECLAYWNYKKKAWLMCDSSAALRKYIMIDFIESNAIDQQWINTGWKTSPTMKVVIDGQFTSIDGSKQQIGNNDLNLTLTDNGTFIIMNDITKSTPIAGDTNRHIFTLNGNGNCYIDNEKISGQVLTRVSGYFNLFSAYGGTSKLYDLQEQVTPSNFKLYSCKIYDYDENGANEQLVRDFVPVRHLKDGSASYDVGLWDKVFNKFYRNSNYESSAKFKAGDDIVHDGKPCAIEKTYRRFYAVEES